MYHTCNLCAEECIPERCPNFHFDWEYDASDPPVDLESPTNEAPTDYLRPPQERGRALAAV